MLLTILNEYPQYTNTFINKNEKTVYQFLENEINFYLYVGKNSCFIDWDESSYTYQWDDLPYWFQEVYAKVSLEQLRNYELKSFFSRPKNLIFILEEFIHCYFTLKQLNSYFLNLGWLVLKEEEIPDIQSMVELFNGNFNVAFRLLKVDNVEEENVYKITEKTYC